MKRLHDRKDNGDRERDRKRDDGAWPYAETDDAHRHDDGDCLPERFHEFADGGFDDDRLVGHERRVDAERQFDDALVDRRFHVASERQDVAAVAHGDGEPDGRLAVDPKHRLRRIGIGATHLGDVAQPDQPPVRQKINVENVPFGRKGAGHPQRQRLVSGLKRACRADSVLRPQRCDQRTAVDAEASELLSGKLDEDLFVLRAEDLNLRDVRHLEQARADVLDIIAQLAMREAISRKAVDQPIGVAEIVVEARSDNASRQRMSYVANVFANLIPNVRDFGCCCRAFEVDEDCGEARFCVAAQEVEALGLLQFALEPIGDLRQRVVHRRAGPRGLHDHCPEGERGVLRAAKPEKGGEAADRHGDHQKDHE